MAARVVDELDDRELLFVSYSHTDDVWAQRFEVLLKPLARRRRLQLWVDRAIRVGDCWRPEIEQAIARGRAGARVPRRPRSFIALTTSARKVFLKAIRKDAYWLDRTVIGR